MKSNLKLDPQKVYDTLEKMPIRKITKLCAYEQEGQFCFAGWVGKELLGLTLRNKYESDKVKNWTRFMNSKIADLLTEVHILEIVNHEQQGEPFSKKEAKNKALEAVKKLIVEVKRK
jgi:hypothetical protein